MGFEASLQKCADERMEKEVEGRRRRAGRTPVRFPLTLWRHADGGIRLLMHSASNHVFIGFIKRELRGCLKTPGSLTVLSHHYY